MCRYYVRGSWRERTNFADTDGIIEAMKLAKKNGLTGIEMFGLEGRNLERIAAASRELGIEDQSVCFRRSCTFRKS